MKEIFSKDTWRHLFTKNEVIFGIVFALIFGLSFSVLYLVGVVPSELRGSNELTLAEELQLNTLRGIGLEEQPSQIATSKQAEPAVRIVATSIGLDTVVINPVSKDYVTLDRALLEGAVYYPDSGTVEQGNMLFFGHSTSYKFVNNKAYQTFNNIRLLKEGEEVFVYTKNTIYVYKVSSVKLVDSREQVVSFNKDSHMITLSTCNSFGAKTDRYVVEAQFDRNIDI